MVFARYGEETYQTFVQELEKQERLTVKAELSDERREELLDSLAEQVTRLGLNAPALLFLELGKPLSFLASQGLLLAQPLLGFLLGESRIEEYAFLLEDEGNLERLLQRLDVREPQSNDVREQFDRDFVEPRPEPGRRLSRDAHRSPQSNEER
ncbi:MAG: hypothetical protein ACE5NP_10565 [Anaerolineae bacterium]